MIFAKIMLIITMIGQLYGTYTVYTTYHTLSMSLIMFTGFIGTVQIYFLRPEIDRITNIARELQEMVNSYQNRRG